MTMALKESSNGKSRHSAIRAMYSWVSRRRAQARMYTPPSKLRARSVHVRLPLRDKAVAPSQLSLISLCIASKDTARIQEAHIVCGHMVCDWIERYVCEERREFP